MEAGSPSSCQTHATLETLAGCVGQKLLAGLEFPTVRNSSVGLQPCKCLITEKENKRKRQKQYLLGLAEDVKPLLLATVSCYK